MNITSKTTVSNVIDYIPMPARFFPTHTNRIFLIKARDNSMEPTISDGELLLFSKLNYESPKEDEIVLCYYGEGLKVKRFNSFKDENGKLQHKLISDNKATFEPLLINPNDDFSNKTQIIAKLIKIIKSV
ncbi:MAG: S24 family peptidase [Endomicrobium sp.]|jgi:phage repressor protein C with HTH and peptisase S24 domain|nr:S24 family peptidase [Endomicrobium sp.]